MLADPAAQAYTQEELRNLEVVRALRRATVEGRKAYMSPGVRIHRRGMAHLAARSGASYTPEGLPDRADEIHAMIAKGDRVWAVWTIHATHDGHLFGQEPTGRPVEVLEVGIWRLADGKVVEAWFLADEYALAQTFGLLP
ncbi:ester cyclase [Nonomuraea endophytica]|uniref:Putative ester cyclase n=1 Tax=Nonomuraea endophytica TaxID=714136 RepID=A0A7W8A3Q3_9ACTN|nr:ester cyclase [Nonomuraea endophytica]MBB5078944.1 putative ester cyclase [Nonomuraea endophytica]